MNLTDLESRTYGPVSWTPATNAVSDFVEITGDDPKRWSEYAPPGFAAAALFSVAPDLLAELYDHSVIHGEQSFSWDRPLAIGPVLEVSGTVSRVRERGGVNFVTFGMEAADDDGLLLTGKSLFLASGESIPTRGSDFERREPPHSFRGEPRPEQRSASRADLVRYASATRDWNPVHWDHEAAVAAGFPGVVVHGLLQASWALTEASMDNPSHRPFQSARFRFRNPLLPARPVAIDVRIENGAADVAVNDDDTEYLAANMVLAK
jgi:acyl dehydratase